MNQTNEAVITANQPTSINFDAANESSSATSKWTRRYCLGFLKVLQGHQKKLSLIIEEFLKLEKLEDDPVTDVDEAFALVELLDGLRNELKDSFDNRDFSDDELLECMRKQILLRCDSLFFIIWITLGRDGESKEIYRSELYPILKLLRDVESFINDSIRALHQRSVARVIKPSAAGYDNIMARRIRAINPKFKQLEKLCLSDEGESTLLADPDKVLQAAKKLRDEIWNLQEDMPAQSEEGMDCSLAIDHLDFLIRVIESKFEFRESDLILISVIVGKTALIVSDSETWLTPAPQGDDVEAIRH